MAGYETSNRQRLGPSNTLVALANRHRHFLRLVQHRYSRLFKKDSTPYLGHNPIGSLAALTMMLCIAIQTLTGLFNTDDYFFGPLSGLVDSASRNWFGQIHDRNFDVLTILIGLHLIAILFYQFYKKQNLSQAMLTGRKPLTELSRHPIKKASLLLALIVILICIAVVYALANCCQDSIPSGEIYF